MSTSCFLKTMKSSCSTLPSTETENITSTCWWFQTAKASFPTFSSETCPLSLPVSRIINIVHQCARTASIASRMRVCSQLKCLIVLSIPNRKWSTPHPTIRKKYQKVQSRCKNTSSSFRSPRRLRGLPGTCWAKESASNTKVHQLHKPSDFACLRVSHVPEFNGKYLPTAEKIRWPSFSSILKIRTASSEASCQTWNRWRL